MTLLYFHVVTTFATSRVAVSWAARGFPMHWSGPGSGIGGGDESSVYQPRMRMTGSDR
jgi:hypothetical protein